MVAPVLEQYTIPVHVGPWTLDDWLALPPSTTRIELVDGMLVMSNMEALPDCNAALGESRGLIPDFAVTTYSASRASRFLPRTS